MGKSDRPHMPGYGLQDPEPEAGLLPWSFVQERMDSAWNYWLASVTPDGKPHAAPLWGIWVEDRFYFSTGADSRKGRNLAQNPEAIVHLESGYEVVILEGVVEPVPPGPLFDELDKQYYDKYSVQLDAENPVYGLTAHKAFAWRERDFPTSATRWRLTDF